MCVPPCTIFRYDHPVKTDYQRFVFVTAEKRPLSNFLLVFSYPSMHNQTFFVSGHPCAFIKLLSPLLFSTALFAPLYSTTKIQIKRRKKEKILATLRVAYLPTNVPKKIVQMHLHTFSRFLAWDIFREDIWTHIRILYEHILVFTRHFINGIFLWSSLRSRSKIAVVGAASFFPYKL